jgi:hypothetical protein
MINLELVKQQLKDVAEDNPEVIKAVSEIADSGNIDEQKIVVQTFINACGGYDAGHAEGMLWNFIDDLFPKFKAEPLADLLEWCPDDMLMIDTVDELFLPAFAGADTTVNERLFKKLLGYYEEDVGMGGEEGATHFDKLFKELDAYFTPAQKAKIAEITTSKDNPANIKRKIENADTATLESLIKELQTLPHEVLVDIESTMARSIEKCPDIKPLLALEWYDFATRKHYRCGKKVLFFMENCRTEFEKVLINLPSDDMVQLSVSDELRNALFTIALCLDENHYSDELRDWLRIKCAEYADLSKHRKDYDTVEKVINAELCEMLEYGFYESGDGETDVRPDVLQKAFREIDKLDRPLPLSREFFEVKVGQNICDIITDAPELAEEHYEHFAAFLYLLPKFEFGLSFSAGLDEILESGLQLAEQKGDTELAAFLEKLQEEQ